MGAALAWRTDDTLIAASQVRADGSRWIIFFEKNGLRHGEFPLPDDSKGQLFIKELYWNCDGSMLAVWMSDGRVDLWTFSNYHWYLKFSIPCKDSTEAVWWSQISVGRLFITDRESTAFVYDFLKTFDRSACDSDDLLSMVAVIDGTKILLTPFAVANVPPPMAFAEIDVGSIPISIALACGNASGKIAVATCDSNVLQFNLILDNQSLLISPANSAMIHLPFIAKRIEFHGNELHITEIDDNASWILNGSDLVPNDRVANLPVHDTPYPAQLPNGEWITLENQILSVDGLEIACNVTSFILHPDFLCTSNPEGLIRFYPLTMSTSSWPTLPFTSEESRRATEGGALCVTVIPKTSALVLQMPRGNLETVYPRAFVIGQVKRLLDGLKYREAFLACRRHRIDLNLLHDHNPELFTSTLGKFIAALPETDHLNLFLTFLRNENVVATRYGSFGIVTTGNNLSTTDCLVDKVNRLSSLIRAELIKLDRTRYAEAIITSFICQSPPDHVAALQLITELSDPQKWKGRSNIYCSWCQLRNCIQ